MGCTTSAGSDTGLDQLAALDYSGFDSLPGLLTSPFLSGHGLSGHTLSSNNLSSNGLSGRMSGHGMSAHGPSAGTMSAHGAGGMSAHSMSAHGMSAHGMTAHQLLPYELNRMFCQNDGPQGLQVQQGHGQHGQGPHGHGQQCDQYGSTLLDKLQDANRAKRSSRKARPGAWGAYEDLNCEGEQAPAQGNIRGNMYGNANGHGNTNGPSNVKGRARNLAHTQRKPGPPSSRDKVWDLLAENVRTPRPEKRLIIDPKTPTK